MDYAKSVADALSALAREAAALTREKESITDRMMIIDRRLVEIGGGIQVATKLLEQLQEEEKDEDSVNR